MTLVSDMSEVGNKQTRAFIRFRLSQFGISASDDARDGPTSSSSIQGLTRAPSPELQRMCRLFADIAGGLDLYCREVELLSEAELAAIVDYRMVKAVAVRTTAW